MKLRVKGFQACLDFHRRLAYEHMVLLLEYNGVGFPLLTPIPLQKNSSTILFFSLSDFRFLHLLPFWFGMHQRKVPHRTTTIPTGREEMRR